MPEEGTGASPPQLETLTKVMKRYSPARADIELFGDQGEYLRVIIHDRIEDATSEVVPLFVLGIERGGRIRRTAIIAAAVEGGAEDEEYWIAVETPFNGDIPEVRLMVENEARDWVVDGELSTHGSAVPS